MPARRRRAANFLRKPVPAPARTHEPRRRRTRGNATRSLTDFARIVATFDASLRRSLRWYDRYPRPPPRSSTYERKRPEFRCRLCHVNQWRSGSSRGRGRQEQPILRPSPLPARDHPARGVALLPVRPELPRCRGPARRAWHRRLLRDGAPVGAQVRSRLCRGDSTAPATAFGTLASGRGLHPDRRQNPLPLACRRRRGRSSRRHR